MTLFEFSIRAILDNWANALSIGFSTVLFKHSILMPLTLGMIKNQSISRLASKTKSFLIRPRSSANLLASIHGYASKYDVRESAEKLSQTALELLRADFCAIEYTSDYGQVRVTKVRQADPAGKITDKLIERLFSDSLFAPENLPHLRQAVILNHPFDQGKSAELMHKLHISSSIVAPLIWAGEVRGTILVGSSNERAFGSSHKHFLTTFSQQAAIILHNSQAYSILKKQARDAETLFRITKTLNSDLPITESLQEALRSLLEMIPLPIGVVLLDDNSKLKCIASLGLSEKVQAALEASPEEGIAAVCLNEKRPIVSAQVENDPRFSNQTYESFYPKSIFAAPLLIEKRAIGVVMVATETADHFFNSDDVRAVTMVATQMAGAVDRARLLKQVEHRAGSLSSILEVARIINSNLQLDDVLPIISRAAKDLLGAQASYIMLVQRETGLLEIEASTDLSEEFTSQTRIPWGEPISGWVAAQAKPVMINSIESETDLPPAQLETIRREGLVSYLGVPLKTKGVTIGVLSVFTRNAVRRFTEEDAELLNTLANQAAVAIENARLFQNEKETVDKLRQLARHRVELANMMSHELRTPLTSIKGFAQLLIRQQDIDRHTLEKHAGIIYSESAKMVDTINDILDLSNMERGLIELRREPVAMPGIIEESVNSASRSFENYSFVWNIPGNLPTIRGDAEKINQIISSLISITVGYNLSKSQILVEAESDSEGIIVSVGGIPTEIDPNQIANLLREPIGFGNGYISDQLRSGALNLYKCQNFIQAHGGKLWLESQENMGSRFRFKLYY